MENRENGRHREKAAGQVEKTAGFIGCGKMGGALAAAASQSGWTLYAADHHPENLERLRKACGVIPSAAREIAQNCRFVFLGVKPQGMERAAAEIAPVLAQRGADRPYTAVTMAAGLSMETVRAFLKIPRGKGDIIRIMPNTPAAVGEGAILYCMDQPGAGGAAEAAFLELLHGAGMLIPIAENKMDAACALSGCGPAFAFLFLEALIQGGVRCGLSGDLARRLALQTVYGAAKLALRTQRDPALLRGEVCSPAGSTIEGVAVLEERAVRSAVLEAVSAAYRRSVELGQSASSAKT